MVIFKNILTHSFPRPFPTFLGSLRNLACLLPGESFSTARPGAARLLWPKLSQTNVRQGGGIEGGKERRRVS